MWEFVKYGRTEERRGGMSRRQFGRIAMLLSAGATLPFYNEAALAQDMKTLSSIPPDAVKINANENPLGPCPAALEAILQIAPKAGRYLFDQTAAFVEAMAATESLPTTHALPGAGSSDLLHRCVLAFTSPARPLVIADPGYEAPSGAAKFVGAKVIQLPLRSDHSHDTPAMARADTNAGMIYICNPNNPTGTVTKKEDLVSLVANKPQGCIVVVDEAYIHFASTTAPVTDLVAADKDVVVLRTFSKLYGMAGLRAGAALARPDLLERLRSYSGFPAMPATGMTGATASLAQKTLVAERRKALADVREDLFDWLHKKGHSFIPSDANMVMIDTKRPGKDTALAMLKHKVAIGRSWAAMPNHVRVTIGTRDEMAKFKTAFDRVMGA